MGGVRDTEDGGSLDSMVAALARRQHGVFARDQLIALGVSRRQIDHRVRSGRWDIVLPRVLRMSGGAYTAFVGAMAAALWAGPDAFVSHGAAAVLAGFECVRAPKVEVWVPVSRR